MTKDVVSQNSYSFTRSLHTLQDNSTYKIHIHTVNSNKQKLQVEKIISNWRIVNWTLWKKKFALFDCVNEPVEQFQSFFFHFKVLMQMEIKESEKVTFFVMRFLCIVCSNEYISLLDSSKGVWWNCTSATHSFIKIEEQNTVKFVNSLKLFFAVAQFSFVLVPLSLSLSLFLSLFLSLPLCLSVSLSLTLSLCLCRLLSYTHSLSLSVCVCVPFSLSLAGKNFNYICFFQILIQLRLVILDAHMLQPI